MTIEYGIADFDKEAWAAIDRREAVQLVIRGAKSNTLRTALAFYRDYFDARQKGTRRRWTWFKFGYYGIRAPAFWGIYNHAELAGMKVTTDEQGDRLVVSFKPQ